MTFRFLSLTIILILTVSLPLLGVWLSGKSVTPYLQHPPRTIPVEPGTFSEVLFAIGGLSVIVLIAPFLKRFFTYTLDSSAKRALFPFPTWGWISLAILIFFWVLAWNRFSWMAAYQLHTFTPLWLSFIFLLNAFTIRRTGWSLMIKQPVVFVTLFPLSAGLWWVFEYLNQFVQNWSYLPVREFDTLTYFLLGSLSFSTVLPAVYALYELLSSCPGLTEPFSEWERLRRFDRKWVGIGLAAVAMIGLVVIGVWPSQCYPLIWISPLLALVSLQLFFDTDHLFQKLEKGDWRPIVLPALSGLLCGFWWELWNSQSAAHWIYSIPYVHGVQIFEMPLLGYAGYFPFGLECLAFIYVVMPHTALLDPNRRLIESSQS